MRLDSPHCGLWGSWGPDVTENMNVSAMIIVYDVPEGRPMGEFGRLDVPKTLMSEAQICLLYTSDAADE